MRFQLFSIEAMETQTVFFPVNIKAMFCLALMAILTNSVFTQNLSTSALDDTRNALMSFYSGVSSPKPTPPPTKRPAIGGWGWSSSKFTELLFLPSFSLVLLFIFFFTICIIKPWKLARRRQITYRLHVMTL